MSNINGSIVIYHVKNQRQKWNLTRTFYSITSSSLVYKTSYLSRCYKQFTCFINVETSYISSVACTSGGIWLHPCFLLWVRVAQSWVFCAKLCWTLLAYLSFFCWSFRVCHSVYGFWWPQCYMYLQTILDTIEIHSDMTFWGYIPNGWSHHFEHFTVATITRLTDTEYLCH